MKASPRVLLGLVFVSFPASAYTFGYAGPNGAHGSDGANGTSGQSTTVIADGQSERFDLSGSDGTDGTSGQSGGAAGACNFYPGDFNQYGAPGGRGGDAGAGGRGGKGGNLTVYTSDLKFLKTISVDARGGTFGNSGQPGWGGAGCGCPLQSWLRTRCVMRAGRRGYPVQHCWNVSYWCSPGASGNNGHQAPQWGGQVGSTGYLTVIPQREPLPEGRSSITLSAGELILWPAELSLQRWSQRTGAASLLAPGSQIQDTYRFFEGMDRARYLLVWKASRPFEFYMQENVSLEWRGGPGVVSHWENPDVWLDIQTQHLEGQLTRETVVRAMRKSEVNDLTLRVHGRGVLLAAEVEDMARVSDLVTTTFSVRLEKNAWWGFKTLYEGKVPVVAPESGAKKHVFTLDLGRLPGVQLSDIKAGENIRLTVTASREFKAELRTQKILTVSRQIGWD